MPDSETPMEPRIAKRYFCELRAALASFREREAPIRIRLIHRATNAENEGVVPYPYSHMDNTVSRMGTGFRDWYIVTDSNGTPVRIEPPVKDIDGIAIVDENGNGIDFRMPAFRKISFAGSIGSVARLREAAERAVRLVIATRARQQRLLRGWRFSPPEGMWWALLFETAWSTRHPLLVAERQIWLVSEHGISFLPYDLTQIRVLRNSVFTRGGQERIPENWLKRLPDAYVSEIADAATASCDLLDLLLEDLGTNRDSSGEVAPAAETGRRRKETTGNSDSATDRSQPKWVRAQRKMFARLKTGTLPKVLRVVYVLIGESYDTARRAISKSVLLCNHFGRKEPDESNRSILDELAAQADARTRAEIERLGPAARRRTETELRKMSPEDRLTLAESLARNPDGLRGIELGFIDDADSPRRSTESED